MNSLTKQEVCIPQTRVTGSARMPLGLTALIPVLVLTLVSYLTGCGGGGDDGNQPAAHAGATETLVWDPVHDPSVIAYFVHYGRQSPRQHGSCAYESSVHASSPSATITNLDPDTRYYFAVSAYNGLESHCSNEVTILTSPHPA